MTSKVFIVCVISITYIFNRVWCEKKMKTQLPIEHVFENMEKEGLEYPFFCEANPLLFVFLVDLYNCEMQVAEVFKVFFFQTADWHWIYLPAAVTCLCLLKFLYEMDKILRYDTILTIAFAHLLTLLEHCGLQRCNSILFPEGSMVMTINPLSITKGILSDCHIIGIDPSLINGEWIHKYLYFSYNSV